MSTIGEGILALLESGPKTISDKNDTFHFPPVIGIDGTLSFYAILLFVKFFWT